MCHYEMLKRSREGRVVGTRVQQILVSVLFLEGRSRPFSSKA